MAGQQRVDFEKQIQPLLEQHCLECHGEKAPEGGLRLTSRDNALIEADSGNRAIIPGDVENSALLERIASTDESVRMPPEGNPLTAQQVELIRRWIAAGADWSAKPRTRQHWAYTAPVKPRPPRTNNRAWPRTEIDRFVLAKLESKSMSPAGPEQPARLIRRVYLALTGLPPTPAEVRRFTANPSPAAYAEIVDRLLDTPAYGERWAQPWLDLARYADSNGYQADQLRDSWAYRDWVIKAINRDLPFDQFTIEQLAGDLLPDATLDQRIATGFHRAVTCNVEAGVHPEQNRVNQVFDRVNTTGTVFLGTTIECAQCHNHKYDPFSQDEYYQLFAFFNNTPTEVKLNSGVRYDFWGPTLDLPLPANQANRKQELSGQLAQLEAERTAVQQSASKQRKQWERRMQTALTGGIEWQPLEVVEFESSGGESHQILEDRSVVVGGSLPGTSVYQVLVTTSETRPLTAFRLEALTHDSIPGGGPGRGDAKRTNFILSELSVEAVNEKQREQINLVDPTADFAQANWPVEHAIDGDRRTGWAIAPEFGKPHWAQFALQQPVTADRFRFTLDQNYGRGRTLGRVRILATADDPVAAALPAEIAAILLNADRKPKQKRQLDRFFNEQNPELAELNRQIETVRQQLAVLNPPTTLIMVEQEDNRDTFKMIRGDYLNPGKKTAPGVPSVLHPMDNALPRNRLGLAQWLTSRQNPLLARVTVNRWWLQFFGHGLVASAEDFGTQSAPPTHPELLDWLAVELMDQGWSRKKLHRQIVMSATFRQAANLSPQLLAVDPGNELYARGPRRRMSAEMIRDHALASSGLLSTQMGGPPIMPHQPAGIWRAVGRNAPQWKEANDQDRYRRGIYVVWRRAAPYPSFVNFDAPDRAACVVQRPQTNTPLQALTLLNDRAFFEMAVSLADSTAARFPDSTTEGLIAAMAQRCISRQPREAEVTLLMNLYKDELERLQQEPGTANQMLAACKQFKQTSDLPQTQLGALIVVANVLLNLDETIHY